MTFQRHTTRGLPIHDNLENVAATAGASAASPLLGKVAGEVEGLAGLPSQCEFQWAKNQVADLNRCSCERYHLIFRTFGSGHHPRHSVWVSLPGCWATLVTFLPNNSVSAASLLPFPSASGWPYWFLLLFAMARSLWRPTGRGVWPAWPLLSPLVLFNSLKCYCSSP